MLTLNISPSQESVMKKYSRSEVMKACLAYFDGDELAATTWMNKYAVKNRDGDFLESTPDQMHMRMAEAFARVESKYDAANLMKNKEGISDYGKNRVKLDIMRIYELFRNFKYVIPQGSVMASLGNNQVIASLSNCVVLPQVYDSYGGIFYTDQQLAQLFKRRCGVGIDLSALRPAGSPVSNAAGTTTGAVSFMERFSNTTREVAQNGRRGALMISMDIAHPDILSFVTVKQDLTKVTGANISVRLTDEFMQAVENNESFMLRWPVDVTDPAYTKMVNARSLWNTIIECAHATAEPGLLFWDRQHAYSTSSVYPGFKNVSTNPCSEIAMQGGDSCRLMAINLFSFVNNPFTGAATFDYDKFYEITYESQRLMDDLVDLELEAIERIISKVESDPEPDNIKEVELETWKLLHKNGKEGRRTGLGFTALADAVAALGIKFDTDDALAAVEKIMKTKCRAEFDASVDMSIERGSFNAFDPVIESTSEFIKMMEDEFPDLYNRMMKYGRRNISISTVAPTGTLSLLARTSSGLEPVFMLSYKRRRKLSSAGNKSEIRFVDALGDAWEEFEVRHPHLDTWSKITGNHDPKDSPYAGATANEIDWHKRVAMQSVVQKYTTHSISSTINLPPDVSKSVVSEIYLNAWKNGLKGITVYREGSRSGVLVSAEKQNIVAAEYHAPGRPKILDAEVVRFINEDKNWIAVVGLLDGKPYEIFTGNADDTFNIPSSVKHGWVIKNRGNDGKSRYDFQYSDKDGYRITIEGLSRLFNKEYWNYAKLISGVLRQGMPLPQVVDLIQNLHLYNESINTWKTGVGRALKKFIPDGTEVHDHNCPECGSNSLIYEEGCIKCMNCGHSKCG